MLKGKLLAKNGVSDGKFVHIHDDNEGWLRFRTVLIFEDIPYNIYFRIRRSSVWYGTK